MIGQSIDLDSKNYTIIGVLPRGFSFAPSASAEFWVPLNTLSPHEQSREFYNFSGVGRLRDGVDAQTALTELKSIASELQNHYSTSGRKEGASVVPLSEVIVGDVRPVLLTLLGTSLLMRSLLFGVRAWDVATLSCATLILALASMLASFLPARRAASVNPTEALRAE